ncbi:hypothetical protein RFI_01049 [Reticulomyxa filosa]|uniref:Uncharacterized protein n=1 Tax=Reticulomyxa filosa TaxID=46433 RepID=X6PD28_RETFI|nr:hypothetical protein RFI_01049 [Reticulomyxa filosa]|eukprot:ETO36013.1 hypothetical protein RFI_01049 [Reticulomyxa filosa]
MPATDKRATHKQTKTNNFLRCSEAKIHSFQILFLNIKYSNEPKQYSLKKRLNIFKKLRKVNKKYFSVQKRRKFLFSVPSQVCVTKKKDIIANMLFHLFLILDIQKKKANFVKDFESEKKKKDVKTSRIFEKAFFL